MAELIWDVESENNATEHGKIVFGENASGDITAAIEWGIKLTFRLERTFYFPPISLAYGMIFHSDKGSQNTSHRFREVLESRGALQSMSGTGRCYDNARMESFLRC